MGNHGSSRRRRRRRTEEEGEEQTNQRRDAVPGEGEGEVAGAEEKLPEREEGGKGRGRRFARQSQPGKRTEIVSPEAHVLARYQIIPQTKSGPTSATGVTQISTVTHLRYNK